MHVPMRCTRARDESDGLMHLEFQIDDEAEMGFFCYLQRILSTIFAL